MKKHDKKNVGYSDKYDALFYKKTGKWLESKCSDKTCEFCKGRPDTAKGIRDFNP